MSRLFIEKIRESSNIDILIKNIRDSYEELSQGNYIPAIISEGDYIKDEKEEFYLNVILKAPSIKVKRTWLNNNLVLCNPHPCNLKDNSIFIHNLITQRKYRDRYLYQINPVLVRDEIYELDYDNNDYVNARYTIQLSNGKDPVVLKKDDNNGYLMVLKNAIKDCLEECYSDHYILYCNFEYRVGSQKLSGTELHGNFDVKEYNEINKNNEILDLVKDGEFFWLRGSIKLPFVKNAGKKKYNLVAYDMFSLEEKEYDPDNYNGDLKESFLIFSEQGIKYLNKYYLLLGINIIDRHNISGTILSEVFEDKIVLFESEFNKLPTFIKDKLVSFNRRKKDGEHLFSQAFFKMQYEVNWNWDEQLEPVAKLGHLLWHRYKNQVFDISLSLFYPQEISDFCEIINKIENLTSIKLEKFNPNAKDIQALKNIREKRFEMIGDDLDLTILFEKYCYAIFMKLEEKNDNRSK